jgi:hypothetical protein
MQHLAFMFIGASIGCFLTVVLWYMITREAFKREGQEPPTFIEFFDSLISYIEQ